MIKTEAKKKNENNIISWSGKIYIKISKATGKEREKKLLKNGMSLIIIFYI